MTTSRGSDVVHAGARVLSADGKQLGIVKEVREDRFLVDVRWAPDYWLGSDLVDNGSDEMVQLLITKEAVGAAKLPGNQGRAGSALDEGGPNPFNRPPPSI